MLRKTLATTSVLALAGSFAAMPMAASLSSDTENLATCSSRYTHTLTDHYRAFDSRRTGMKLESGMTWIVDVSSNEFSETIFQDEGVGGVTVNVTTTDLEGDGFISVTPANIEVFPDTALFAYSDADAKYMSGTTDVQIKPCFRELRATAAGVDMTDMVAVSLGGSEDAKAHVILDITTLYSDSSTVVSSMPVDAE